jgi:hypothetical protein
MARPDSVPCVICGRDAKRTAPFHMTHGITIWLCPPHRAPGFLRRRHGQAFTDRLARAWRAAGADTTRRRAALAAHRRRTAPEPPARRRPGSYTWPGLRREAEARFATGEDPRNVIRDLRRRYRTLPANVPSIRTMRRWHTQARWLDRATGTAAATLPVRKPAWLRRPRRSEWPDLQLHLDPHPFGLLAHLWVDDTPPRRTHWRRN